MSKRNLSLPLGNDIVILLNFTSSLPVSYAGEFQQFSFKRKVIWTTVYNIKLKQEFFFRLETQEICFSKITAIMGQQLAYWEHRYLKSSLSGLILRKIM